MFPWLYNRVVLDVSELLPILEEQNRLLQDISGKLANHTAEWVSLIATVVLGGITYYITKQQKQLVLQQHKLELSNRRWGALEELKLLEKEYFKFAHSATMEEIADDPSKNYYLFDEKLRLFNKKRIVVFDDYIYEELEVLRKQCEQHHSLLEKYWNTKRQLQNDNSNKILQQEERTLCQQIGKSLFLTYAAWNIAQEKLINFAQCDKF